MRKIFFVIGLFFTLTACLEDHTNLDYADVLLPDSVTLVDLSTGNSYELTATYAPIFKVRAGEELQLEANAAYEGSDSLIYEWRIGYTTVGYGKSFRYTVTQREDYGFLVLHRSKGESASVYQFSIDVHDSWGSGIAVLGMHGEKTVFDFIERYWYEANAEWQGQVIPNFTFTVYNGYENVYETFNDGESLPGVNPVGICRTEGSDEDKTSGLLFLDKEWQKSMSVNAKTMEKVVSLGEEFVTPPVDMVPVKMVTVGKSNILQDENGNLYTRVNYDNGVPNTGRFTDQPLAYKDPNDVEAEMEVVHAADIVTELWYPLSVVYDKDRQRFLALATSTLNYEYYQFFNLANPTNAAQAAQKIPNYVNLDKFDKEVIALLAPRTKMFTSGTYMIFYKEGDKYFMQQFYLNIGNYNMTPFVLRYEAKNWRELGPDVCELLASGKEIHFRLNTNARTYQDEVFFSVGNTIYQLSADGQTATFICRFDKKETITDFVLTGTWNSTGANGWNRYFNGRVFAAAFDDGDLYVTKLYDDPFSFVEIEAQVVWAKHYDGGVKAMLYY